MVVGASWTPRDVLSGAYDGSRGDGISLVRLELSGIAGDAARLRELVVAVQLLRSKGSMVEYELDLFEGSPRFVTVRDNVALLRAIVVDGTTAARFTVNPLVGGRSPWVESYRQRVAPAVQPWLSQLSERLAEAWLEVMMGERMLLGMNGVAAHRIALQRLTLRSNTELLNLVSDSAREFELSGDTSLLDDEFIRPRIDALTGVLLALRNRFQPGAALTG
jgi:hypothetical protein